MEKMIQNTPNKNKSHHGTYIGHVTQIDGTHGFIDESIVFHVRAVHGPSVIAGAVVIYDLEYNPDMHIKWSASSLTLAKAKWERESSQSTRKSMVMQELIQTQTNFEQFIDKHNHTVETLVNKIDQQNVQLSQLSREIQSLREQMSSLKQNNITRVNSPNSVAQSEGNNQFRKRNGQNNCGRRHYNNARQNNPSGHGPSSNKTHGRLPCINKLISREFSSKSTDQRQWTARGEGIFTDSEYSDSDDNNEVVSNVCLPKPIDILEANSNPENVEEQTANDDNILAKCLSSVCL
ncbi:s1-like domain-containing protein [Ditylenchus destructor]|uniref:S1-like domain-containing protein n=1 Tax=Ditylenchus destructor TaxID=166010 RepID=A0AAD4N6T2_9BILA|nr:s1-like domain-containing protein [Ditylenchus destructor]